MKLNPLVFGTLFFLGSLNTNGQIETGVKIKTQGTSFELYVDGVKTYIKGVGGTNKLELASQNGANAFRTWGGNVESVKKNIEMAKANKMFIMQGIGMSKNPDSYKDEEYKNKLRASVKELAETFKDDENILLWGIGNEIDLGNKANIGAAWIFVDELAQLIKSIDQRHLVSTVISYNPGAVDSIAKYTHNLDLIGINCYAAIAAVEKMMDKSNYKGAYMITEWGPSGFWEMPSTLWKAPLEQTSEEKRLVYEERYTKYILNSKRCLGSFVFLWGQKEERTPTWFSMFVEKNVEGLPLNGEKTPMIEAMERVWKGTEPVQTAPVVNELTINGKKARQNVYIKVGETIQGLVDVTDKEGNKLTYVWEILKEASKLGSGGSFEPRPERVGIVETTKKNKFKTSLSETGNYRLYVYVLDNTGFVATANVPFQVINSSLLNMP